MLDKVLKSDPCEVPQSVLSGNSSGKEKMLFLSKGEILEIPFKILLYIHWNFSLFTGFHGI